MLPRHTPIIGILALVFAVCVGAVSSYAQDKAPLRVVEVKMPKQVRDPITQKNWMQIEVVLQADDNTHPAALDKNFFERVTVTPTFAWGSKKKGAFSIEAAFGTTVQIAAVPAKSKQVVYFYIPAEVAAAYKLGTQITFYYVAVSYAGITLPPAKTSVPAVMQDALANVGDFVGACSEKLARTKGMLLPHNLVPGYMLATNLNISRDMATLVSPLDVK